MTSAKRFKFALFGAGRIGSVHLRDLVLSSRAEVTWIVEEDVSRARDLVIRYNLEDKTKTCHIESKQEVLDDTEVDAVMVCTPSFRHEDIILAALRAGKAVFCEKPLAPTLEGTQAAYEEAETAGKPLFCAFNRRFDPQLSRLQAVAASGEIGQVRYIHQVSRDPAAMMTESYLKTSGGILVDSVIHDIDTALWLVGDVPQTVYAIGKVIHPMYARCNDVDICVVNMTFENGAIVTINMCREAPLGHDTRVEIVGSKAVISTGNKRPIEYTKVTIDGDMVDPIYVQGLDRYTDSYTLELEHFLDVLQGKAKMLVTKESTLNAIRVVNLAKASMADGQVHKFTC